MKAGRFLTAVMIVFALVVVPGAAYVGAYYGMPIGTFTPSASAVQQINNTRTVFRFYRHRWQARAFAPAAGVEAWLTGNDVAAICYGDLE